MRDVQRRKAQLEAHEQLLRLAVNWKLAEQAPPASSNGRTAEPQPTAQPSLVGPRLRWGGDSGRVSTRQAILIVLGEREGVWTKDDLVERLREHGWMPTSKNARNQVTSRLGELVAKGEVIRYGEGRYSLSAANRLRQGTLPGAGETSE